ncbi:hypothetical protein BGZ60DRAFT_22451 [Tricladium varicosporioides]|nr:hypothetical protein BGZ60DRAFT_22451 [Hymenoscyphus varicosporioides]
MYGYGVCIIFTVYIQIPTLLNHPWHYTLEIGKGFRQEEIVWVEIFSYSMQLVLGLNLRWRELGREKITSKRMKY